MTFYQFGLLCLCWLDARTNKISARGRRKECYCLLFGCSRFSQGRVYARRCPSRAPLPLL